jgi:PAS domain-containing protein
VEDITERKLAEQALRRGEERFRSLTMLSRDWYRQQDEQFRFTALFRHRAVRAMVLSPADLSRRACAANRWISDAAQMRRSPRALSPRNFGLLFLSTVHLQ